MLLGNMFAHGSVMLRKEAVLEVGGYSEAMYAEDYDLWIRLARKHRVGNIREGLYRYRSNPQGFSSVNAARQARDARNLISELCRVRGYRDFWAVPGYSMRRWATGGFENDGESAARLSREDLHRNVSVMRFLWSLGERRAALRRLNALVRYRPMAFGREAVARLVRRISYGLGADRHGQGA